MRPYKMTVMRTDMIFMHKLMTIVSIPRPMALPTKGADYGNIRTSAKRPEWNQDKSGVEPHQKADYLLFGGGTICTV